MSLQCIGCRRAVRQRSAIDMAALSSWGYSFNTARQGIRQAAQDVAVQCATESVIGSFKPAIRFLQFHMNASASFTSESDFASGGMGFARRS